MRIKFSAEYDGRWGKATAGEVRVVSRPAGKELIREGVAIETDELANEEIAASEEVIRNRQQDPQVVVIPVPGGKEYYETTAQEEE